MQVNLELQSRHLIHSTLTNLGSLAFLICNFFNLLTFS